jgi:hypothetical protein
MTLPKLQFICYTPERYEVQIPTSKSLSSVPSNNSVTILKYSMAYFLYIKVKTAETAFVLSEPQLVW